MENQLQEFVNMINNQVGIVSDESIRKQSEKLMAEFRTNQPDLFIQLLLAALKTNQDVSIRTYCASQLRKNLSDFSESSFKNLWWEKITPETQAAFKTQILECLDGESSSNVRGLVADAIGEIGASLVKPLDETKQNQWPELLDLLWKFFQSDRNPIIESGFRILSNLLLFVDEIFMNHREQLKLLIQNGFGNQDINLKLGAIEVLRSFIGTVEPKEVGKYIDLVPPMLEATIAVLGQDEDLGEKCLESIVDISEEEPKFFKQNFAQVFTTINKIFAEKSIDNMGLKRIGLEALILIIERYPSVIKNNEDFKKQLIEMIFIQMLDQDEDIEEKWMKPAEGFRENFADDEDNANTQFGMTSIDRLMECVGQDKLMSVLSNYVQQMLQNQDWRYPFAALMSLSQIGEYMDEVSDIMNILPVIFSFVENQNCKVRYAALHAIGQISDDMQPDFQQKFHKQVLPLLVKAMDDPVPRVAAHSLASMANFMEGCDKEMIQPYLKDALQKSFVLLQNGISLVKENALSNIAALAEAADSDFNQYYQECIPIIMQVYTQYQGKEYKQLRGCVVESITIIGDSIDKELFLPYLADTVQLIQKIQDNDLEQVDPQKNFVLTGWSRLCNKYNKEFVQFLPQVLPSVVKVIKEIMDSNNAQLDADEEQVGHTYQHKEASSAMHMIEIFIEKLNEDLGPYIPQLTEIILPLLNCVADEDVRSQAAKCLPGLINCLVKKDRDTAVRLTREFIQILYTVAEKEYDAETICNQMHGMKGCIENVGQFLNQQELHQLSENIIKLLMQSDERKAGNKKLAAEDPELEEEERALYELDTSNEEELHVAIAELLGILFKTHADLSGEIADLMYTKFLPQVLGDSVTHKMHKFGIFLVDDMIEFLGFNRISAKWDQLAEALAKFCISKDCSVRQATTYGIGVFAEQTPKSEFQKYSQILLERLVQALEIPQGKEQNEKSYIHCKDNVIAAIGKIIKFQAQNIQQLNQVLDYFLKQLPIRKDKGEAHIIHDFLCDMLLDTASNATVFQNQENYKQVVQIFGKIYGKKSSNSAIDAKIKNCLKLLAGVDLVKNSWNDYIRELSEDEQQALQEATQ